ncbi:mannitol dehydrogenase [Subtercola boreus]|uniref:Mannitol-1-phosphate 5-dehydrogenase n=1 Tax=Subtercola boreus TaxID=120213 RepID=A0A3E0VCK7_9MICO|nr:mannitol dehydrogenase family protein [Subtercola boreus]RFA07395.1 mannitol dehydrogenase [Subtercola boreus]
MVRLNSSTLSTIGQTVAVPHYNRTAITTGIVHFGVGAFHRSHEAMFVDRSLSAGVDLTWGICGVGVLASDKKMRDVLADQDNLYTLVVKHPGGAAEARVVGSIAEYLFAPDDPEAVIAKLAHPQTRIVSLTVTEGGYNVNDATGEFDGTNPAVLDDLKDGAVPATVFGLITEGLRRRREAGIPPFTVMSCDNIQGNGHVARQALTSYALLKDPSLGEWIAANVSFPNSMVDRITPATTDASRAEVSSAYGIDDEWPVVSEAFEQWVLEDAFTLGRPDLESVGVQVVADVEPYELMKLRLLNASHQAMSYLGMLAGYEYVHEVCQAPLFRQFLLDYMTLEATPTLQPVPGIDLEAYRHELIARFSSTAIADTLARQVVDASERIPKFLLPVVRAQLASGGPIEHCALVIAAWSVYLEGSTESGAPIVVTDVRKDVLTKAAHAEATSPGALLDLTDVFGDLGTDARFRAAYREARATLLADGSVGALRALALARD